MVRIDSVEVFAVTDDAPEVDLDASAAGVSAGLRLLDGDRYDQLSVFLDGSSSSLHVSGGERGWCQLMVLAGGGESVLIDLEHHDPEPDGEHTSGGQTVDVPSIERVSRDAVGRALFFFLLTEALDPGLNWRTFRRGEVVEPG